MLPPLLSPKPFAEYSPQAWKSYVESLYKEPIRAIPKEFSFSVNKKGTLVLRITRAPKFLHSSEVDAIALELGWKKQDTWNVIRKKEIEIRRPLVVAAKNKTGPNSRQPVPRPGQAKK